MGILLTISDLLIPVTVLCIVVFGCLQRMDIYEVFLEGAKGGPADGSGYFADPNWSDDGGGGDARRGASGHSGAADSPGGRRQSAFRQSWHR